MNLFDRLARAWLTRKGAEWRSETCGTCAWNVMSTKDMAVCRRRVWGYDRMNGLDLGAVNCGWPACPAWQRKEDA